MSKVLPLNSVWPENAHQLGEEIANLAKLRHLKLPVPEGLVVSPPREEIAELMSETDPAALKRKVLKIPLPGELVEMIGDRKVEATKLWTDLLEVWGDQLARLVQNNARNPLSLLEPKYCLFTGRIKSSGKVYFDLENNDTEIVIDQGKLTPAQLKFLDQTVAKLHRQFLIDFIYEWVVDDELKFVRVLPYDGQALTQDQPVGVVQTKTGPFKRPKIATKLFWPQQSLVTDPECDGAILRAADFAVDMLRFNLIESGHTFKDKPVIMILGSGQNSLSGASELLSRKSQLEKEIEAVLWARNKQQLLNVWVGVPICRNANELKVFKQTAASMGVNRKGSLKLWLEVGVPENLIRFEQYAMVGIDGVCLNLDLFASCLLGVDVESIDVNEIEVLTTFLKSYLKNVSRFRLPIISYGRLLQNDQLVKELVKLGVWGMMPHQSNLDELQLRLAKFESLN